MAIGWLADVAEATTYFTKRLNGAKFTGLADDTEKTAALTTAYNMLVNDTSYLFPDTATELMKDAQCEQTLYILISDVDRRSALVNLGVTRADIVGEEYKGEKSGDPLIAPRVQAMLKDFKNPKKSGTAFFGNVKRDDAKDVY